MPAIIPKFHTYTTCIYFRQMTRNNKNKTYFKQVNATAKYMFLKIKKYFEFMYTKTGYINNCI